jgi:hypothetical protein
MDLIFAISDLKETGSPRALIFSNGEGPIGPSSESAATASPNRTSRTKPRTAAAAELAMCCPLRLQPASSYNLPPATFRVVFWVLFGTGIQAERATALESTTLPERANPTRSRAYSGGGSRFAALSFSL